jgi:phage FluMu protein Com
MCDRCRGEIRLEDIRMVDKVIQIICPSCKEIIETAEKERNDISYRRP